MNNFLFREINNDIFYNDYYGDKVVYGNHGLLGEKLSKTFSNYKNVFESLGSQIKDDLFIFKDGVACKKYIYYDELKNIINWDYIWSMHENENATIYLRGLQKYLNEIAPLIKTLRQLFPQRIPFANIFISPSNAIGLNAHFDPTEFFIFQISGEKHWEIWNPPPSKEAEIMMPKDMANYCKKIKDTLNPSYTFNIKSGQVLYLPLYWIHSPYTISSHSIHITIGLAHPELRKRKNREV